jgi:tetratricopeptide (TPR) repeat protein
LRSTSKIADWELTRCEALAYMDSGDHAKTEQLLRSAVQTDPKDPSRVGTLADFYRARAIQLFRDHKEAEAALALTNSLANMNQQLLLLASSSHEASDAPDLLLRKAEVEMMLHSFSAAVSTLSQVLVVQPKNYNALLNRATSEIEIKRFQAAKDDLKEIAKIHPRLTYLVEFGLADVAAAEKNKPDQIIYLKRCVRDAPKESSEYARATNQLAMLARQ